MLLTVNTEQLLVSAGCSCQTWPLGGHRCRSVKAKWEEEEQEEAAKMFAQMQVSDNEFGHYIKSVLYTDF